MATVLIMGASRGIGLEAVKVALAAGHEVRALSRSARGIKLDHPKLRKVAADALDEASVERALEGVDAVIQTLGVTPSIERAVRPTDLFSTATRVLVRAMQKTGVRRLIAVTGLGAGDSRNRGGPLYNIAFNLILRRVYEDKDVQEDLIQDSGLDWVIVRPVILTRGSRTGRYRVLVEPRSWRTGFISRADVADFLIKQIGDDTYLGKAPVLTG